MKHHHESTTQSLTNTSSAVSADKIQEQIRQRAYELYEQRGREDGHDIDDWISAELEVNRQKKAMAA